MKTKKLLSIILAALVALDVVCCSLTLTYHIKACETNASISVEEVFGPSGKYTEEEVIIAPSYEPGHYISFPMHPDYTENWLFIKRKQAVMNYGDNQSMVPMVAENMFPGDSISKSYSITIAHQYKVDLSFTVENIRTTPDGDTTPLSDILSMRVYINGYAEPAYDGLIKDFTEIVARYGQYNDVLNDTAVFTIEVYLPTSAGNEYMSNGLMCDFVWTLYEDDYALGTDIIPIHPDDWPWPDKPPVDPEEPEDGEAEEDILKRPPILRSRHPM